jgi:hypothetical protein
VSEMLLNIISKNDAYSPKSAKELERIDFSQIIKDSHKAEPKERKEILKAKVRSVARMARLFKNLRYFYYNF